MKWIYLLCLCVFGTAITYSQQEHCALDEIQQLLAEHDTAYAKSLARYTLQLEELSTRSLQRSAVVMTLPVVVHVIHQGEAIGNGSNISNERVYSQLDVLNEDYRRMNGDASNTPSTFINLAADAEIEFCLAALDPSDNASSGITRHIYGNIPDISYIEQVIKPATTWDPDRYINIWTVRMPSGSSNVLGYAYLPTSQMVGSNRDGVVISYTNFGIISTTNRGRTTTHEMGHYLGLKHPWGDNDSNGNPIGCNSDDGVADTPNASGPYYDCPVFGQSSCGSVDMNMNFMDYVDDPCMNLFTAGQASLMFSVLNGIRSSLTTETETLCQLNTNCVDLLSEALQMGFEVSDNTDDWAIEDRNNDQVSWNLNLTGNSDWGPNSGSGVAVYLWNNDGVTAADDFLFTPCFEISKGKAYELEFSIASASDNTGIQYPERFEVGFSSLQNAADFFSPDNWRFDPFDQTYPNYQDERLLFEALEDASISIGFHVFSDADQYAMQLDDIRIRDLGTVAVDEVATVGQFHIFPNPIQDQLNIQLNRDELAKDAVLSLYDVRGRLIWHTSVPKGTASTLQFDMQQLDKGIYFVKLHTTTTTISRKLVKLGN